MQRNILKYIVLTAVFLFGSPVLFAQKYVQSFRGNITEKQSNKSISEATVQLSGKNYSEVVASDSSGNFSFLKIPAGDYRIEISHNSFLSKFFPQIEISTGKEIFLAVEMEIKLNQLKEVVINAYKDKTGMVNTIGMSTFQMEQSERFAASLNDPQRLVLSFAGVRGIGGLQNSIIVRGNSPKGVMWRLEGIEVPSPNHYNGMGTAGLVSILNNLVLKKVDFYSGAFPAQFGNATSAVFDATLRRGNPQRYEFSVQLSNLGLETSAEGPLSKKNSSSFLIAYRYSTVGLMGKIGYAIGNYLTAFQDVNFKFHIATKRAGFFEWWGFGGISSIENAKRSMDNENFRNQYITVATGITHQILFRGKTSWRTTLAMSGYSDSYHVSQYENYISLPDLQYTGVRKTIYEYRDISLRLSSQVNHTISSRVQLSVAIQIIKPFIHLTDSTFQQKVFVSNATGDTISNEKQPVLSERVTEAPARYETFIQFNTSINEKLQLQTGVRATMYGQDFDWLVEPRVNLKWRPKQSHSLELATGLHSRFELPVFYGKEIVYQNHAQPNKNLKPSKAFHASGGYSFSFLPDFNFKTEIYFQYLFAIPAQVDTYLIWTSPTQYEQRQIPVSLLNMINYFDYYYRYENKGEGMNYGIEFTLEKIFSKNYYCLFTTSLYNSLYRVKPLGWYNTPFNGNWIVTLTGGKDFRVGKKYKANIISLNTRLLVAGNDRTNSYSGGINSAGDYKFKGRLKTFVQWDFRVAFRRNLKKYSWELSCDIQNLINRKNESNSHYNLNVGIFPVLKYRIDFGFLK